MPTRITHTHLLLCLGTFVLLIFTVFIVYYCMKNKEGFATDTLAYKTEEGYNTQVKLLTDTYGPTATAKRPITDLLANETKSTETKYYMPESQQNFVNFYALACRYPGYLGPMINGYYDPDIGIQHAVNAGCRTFVLDIDYLDDCKEPAYFPRLVVRDTQGKLLINYNSNQPLCNSMEHNTIKTVCEKINFYAFADSCQNKTDPVVIVLYFLRQPPGSYKSKTVLDYYSNVAKSLSPFQDRFITNELDGGTFYRQKQESRLLINKISDYNGKVLVFSNANTTGFRETKTYSPDEDLDFMVHLRLSYTQTKMGVTENDSGSAFGILQTAEDFTIVPAGQQGDVMESTKLRWTVCLSKDPAQPVSQANYKAITEKFGVNCVPTVLFDPASSFMFTDKTFKTYGFIPKPEALRYVKPPIVIAAEPNPSMNANQGKIRAPTIGN